MKSKIIELIYEYNRRAKTDNAKISWTDKFVVKFYNLDLLHDIYCGKIGKAEAKRRRNIQYAVVEILDTLIGDNRGKRIKINCILCDNILYYSQKLCFHKEDVRINILELFDERSSNDFSNR